MLDMSKAFDTVNRKLLLDQHEKILEPNEMFLLSVLINETKLTNTSVKKSKPTQVINLKIFISSC